MQEKAYKRSSKEERIIKRRQQDENTVREDAHKFLRAHVFIEDLRQYTNKLTMQEYRDLRQMALDGNIEVARTKLEIIMRTKV